MIDSYRRRAILDLCERLSKITKANGYNSDAGLNIFVNEAPKWGEDDPSSALSVVVGADSVQQMGRRVLSRIPVQVQAFVPATVEAPFFAVENIVADVRFAVEIEGHGPDRGDRDRSLDGTTPKGLERGTTQPVERPAGSSYVGTSCEYVVVIQDAWGQPGDGSEST